MARDIDKEENPPGDFSSTAGSHSTSKHTGGNRSAQSRTEADRAQANGKAHVTFFRDWYATTLSTDELTLEELQELILKTDASSKDRLPWLKLGRFGDKPNDKDCLRYDENVEKISGVEADYDDKKISLAEAAKILEAAHLKALLYTSPSYSEAEPKWRILTPASEELEPGERSKMLARLNGLFGDVFSNESFTLSQSYYYGSVAHNPKHQVILFDGDYIDQRDDLDAGAMYPKKPTAGKDGNSSERLDWTVPIGNILNGEELHDNIRNFAASMVTSNVSPGAAKALLRALMQGSAARRDDRWQDRFDDIDRTVDGAVRKYDAEKGADKKDIPEFPLIDIATWQGKIPPPRDWVVDERVPARVVTGLYGDGGVGKTILLLQLAVCVVLGIDWLGAKISISGPVLIMCCEDDVEELWRRLDKIADYYGTDFAALKARGFHIATFAGKDATLAYADQGQIQLTNLYAALYKKAQEIRPRLIGIDNLADVFAGNEIIRTQVRQFMTKLHAFALDFNNAVALTAHPSLAGLSSGKGTSGSTGWNNAFRSRMYFRKEEKENKGDEIDKDYRELEVMKANYGEEGEIVRLRWANGVFVPDKSIEINEIDPNATKRAQEEEFLMRLDEFEQQGRPVSDKPRANNYAPHMFSRDGKNKSRKKHVHEEAMERLFHQRRIRNAPYGRASQGWIRIVRYDPSAPSEQGAEIIDFPAKDKPKESKAIPKIRVFGPCGEDAICLHCRKSGDVKRIKNASKPGSKSETLHEECAAEWFAKHQ